TQSRVSRSQHQSQRCRESGSQWSYPLHLHAGPRVGRAILGNSSSHIFEFHPAIRNVREMLTQGRTTGRGGAQIVALRDATGVVGRKLVANKHVVAESETTPGR